MLPSTRALLEQLGARKPYGLELEGPPRPIVARSIPAAGTRVAIRWSASHGQLSARYGAPWTPYTTERLTETHLIVRSPAHDRRDAYDLRDAWEIARADDVTFWKRCRTCAGMGEAMIPGSDFVAPCVDCAGWGDIPVDGFAEPTDRRERREYRHAARMPEPQDHTDHTDHTTEGELPE